MKTIGITGNIGSGKSSVSKILAEQGYKVLDSDSIAKKLMNENENIKKKLIENFGKDVYLSDNLINTEFLSKKVYGEKKECKENLQALNKIVHPEVLDYLREKIEEFELEGSQICFVESALIYEADLEEAFDFIIVVHSDPENSFNRLKNQKNITRERFEAVEKEQISRREKRELADFVILNDKDFESLEKTTLFVLSLIKSLNF
ncbi:MAG: dephospho-CoA kinase [Ignavibacteria bacterium]|nr:dephospho-CoA kinase [Ignavibacteria bacterium]